MGGLPNDAEAKKVIKVLRKEWGWEYDDSTSGAAHPCGWLLCGAGCRNVVYKTGRDTARALWRDARRCTHGRAPKTNHW